MDEVLQQLLALAAFFAFPAFQYSMLRRYRHRQGEAQLWYLPTVGFRLVIRNMGGKRTLSDIKYRALVRRIVPPGDGVSVATWRDRMLIVRDDFFLFPGSDQILLAFQLHRNRGQLELTLSPPRDDVHEQGATPAQPVQVENHSKVIVDYVANIENLLNFDVRMARRIELDANTLSTAYAEVIRNDVEQRIVLPKSALRDVG